MITPEQIRQARIRAMARTFATEVRGSGMAHRVPEYIIDRLTDSEIPEFFQYLREFRLRQRGDWMWERVD